MSEKNIFYDAHVFDFLDSLDSWIKPTNEGTRQYIRNVTAH